MIGFGCKLENVCILNTTCMMKIISINIPVVRKTLCVISVGMAEVSALRMSLHAVREICGTWYEKRYSKCHWDDCAGGSNPKKDTGSFNCMLFRTTEREREKERMRERRKNNWKKECAWVIDWLRERRMKEKMKEWKRERKSEREKKEREEREHVCVCRKESEEDTGRGREKWEKWEITRA